jgi:hypothetical protein
MDEVAKTVRRCRGLPTSRRTRANQAPLAVVIKIVTFKRRAHASHRMICHVHDSLLMTMNRHFMTRSTRLFSVLLAPTGPGRLRVDGAARGDRHVLRGASPPGAGGLDALDERNTVYEQAENDEPAVE